MPNDPNEVTREEFAQRVQKGITRRMEDEACTYSEAILSLLIDHEEVAHDKRRLVRNIDIIMHGDGAAPQASLCDLVRPIQELVEGRNQQQAKLDAMVKPETHGFAVRYAARMSKERDAMERRMLEAEVINLRARVTSLIQSNDCNALFFVEEKLAAKRQRLAELQSER